MRYVLSLVTLLAWGLWFGGLMTLFLAVQTIFGRFSPDRQTAGTAAAGVFGAFERYQLLLAGVAIIGCAAWRLVQRSNLVSLVCGLMLLAAMGALTSTMGISPRIEAMREAHQTDTPEFRKLHGQSMMVYASQAGILGLAGIVLPLAMTCRGNRGKQEG